VRNKKLDFEVLSQDQLDRKLSTGTKYEKKYLLLTQIGYIRINLFQEYYERIQITEESKDFDKAVDLMKEYLQKIAMPFIQERLNPSIFSRITNLFSTSTLPDAAQTLKEWENTYESWNKQKETGRMEEKKNCGFQRIKHIFFTLYTLSFSVGNFPSVAVEPAH
jgi:YesN/AraC family two-component response regulator